MRILITGASGSGTTTLAKALGEYLQWTHLDLDDYYWVPTSPPFREKREASERHFTCFRDLCGTPSAVLSGSLVGWGTDLEDAFDLVVFLYLSKEVRIDRLRKREVERFGAVDPAFLEWAGQYDEGPSEGRSLAKHLAWLAARTCPVIRIEGDLTVSERMRKVLESMPNQSIDTDVLSAGFARLLSAGPFRG